MQIYRLVIARRNDVAIHAVLDCRVADAPRNDEKMVLLQFPTPLSESGQRGAGQLGQPRQKVSAHGAVETLRIG